MFFIIYELNSSFVMAYFFCYAYNVVVRWGMSNFSEFMNNNTRENLSANNHNDRAHVDANNFSKDRLQSMIDDYSGLSENELLKEFLSKTMERKVKGELNDDELEKIKDTISPMLNDSQKKKMNELFDMVRRC